MFSRRILGKDCLIFPGYICFSVILTVPLGELLFDIALGTRQEAEIITDLVCACDRVRCQKADRQLLYLENLRLDWGNAVL
jgi:hypothetical protein